MSKTTAEKLKKQKAKLAKQEAKLHKKKREAADALAETEDILRTLQQSISAEEDRLAALDRKVGEAEQRLQELVARTQEHESPELPDCGREGPQRTSGVDDLRTGDPPEDSQGLMDIDDERGSEDRPPEELGQWRGAPINIELQDAEIHDVLLLFGDLGRVQIMAGQGVQGQVTMKLNSVPWDQALDLILTSLKLGRVEEGKVIRVDPLPDLAEGGTGPAVSDPT